MRRISLLAHLGLFITSVISQTCYLPNGDAVRDRVDAAPCSFEPVRSICCSLNRVNPPGGDIGEDYQNATRDECLPNGLCQNRYSHNNGQVTDYWIEYCTDSDIKSGKCLDYCPNRDESGAMQVTPCDGKANSTKWCCGTETDCCDKNDYFELPQLFGSTLPSSSATTSPPTASSTKPASPSQSTQPSSGLSTGAIAGIGIAAVLSVVALVSAGFFAHKAYQWRNETRRLLMDTKTTYQYVDGTGKSHAMYYPPAELSTVSRPTELPRAAVSPTELS